MGVFLNDHGLEQEVLKHGSHNQSSHGRRGRGSGKDIQDLSPSDQKEYIRRMSSAKNYEEAREIIADFKPKLPGQSPQADKDRSGTSKVLVDDMTQAEESLNDLSGRLISRGDELQVNRAIRNFTNAKKDFNDAIKLKGKEQTKKMQAGVGNVFAGMNQLSLVDDKRAENIAQSISDELQSTFGSADSAFQSLGVDVDDIFGA
jgi:hypothetical protein